MGEVDTLPPRKDEPMGCFRVTCTITPIHDRGAGVEVPDVLVDTGSELTWIDRTVLERAGVQTEKKDRMFTMANGQRITRSVGFAIVAAEGEVTVDEVVFAEAGDLNLLGARSLEGMNLRVEVEPAQKQLVAAGPIPAAAAGDRG